MEQLVTQEQTLNKESIEYYTVYRVAHPASVSSFLGLAHAYVQRRSGANFAHHWFVVSASATVIAVSGSRNALTLFAEYINSHVRYLSGFEVVYHGWGLKKFNTVVDDLYARRLSLREGVSR
ncbi:hypothetical protein IMW75_03305 [Pseudomonas gregormendelii]|uniref:Uncharacterized protein n=1 Tax=Pseudomonas gregormendelii TaxID=1628277 RepID=A0ABS3ABJ1_9PSED|nr:hypothetical protein [Pseudomonas gregormendelii]MBN3964312.1 hypothetical protein [Pseudomonas gregormendelii]